MASTIIIYAKSLHGIQNRGTYNKAGMHEDLARHPYSLTAGKCVEEVA